MRLALALAVAVLTARAQPPGYLLDDLADTAKWAIPHFRLEANLRVAELTRLSDPVISRRFAAAAASSRQGGMAYYYAMRTFAGLDFDAAVAAAAESSDPMLAYRALTEQAFYVDDRERFLKLLEVAHGHDAYGLQSIYLALQRWSDDEIFVKDLTAQLVNGLPEDASPNDAIYLFEAFRAIGPESIDKALLRRAITAVSNAVLQPGFDLPELRQPTLFRIHGQTITTHSLSEAAFLRALAFSAAIDEKEFLSGVYKLVSWAPLLKGLQLEDLAEALRPLGSAPRTFVPPPVEDVEEVPDLRITPFDEALPIIRALRLPKNKVRLLLELAQRPGLTDMECGRINHAFGGLLESLGDAARLDAMASLYATSLAWPRMEEQDEVTVMHAREIERLASINEPFAARIRDSGDLLIRLDDILARLGRVPAKWPETRLRNRSLLLRHYVYEVEQATLYGVVDASFRITGGSDITLRDLRGRVVVIVFWRTDCRLCQPLRQAINRLNKPPGIHGIWAIAVSDEPEDAVLQSLDKSPFWASIGLDESGRVARSFAVPYVPSAVVIDRAGHLVARIVPKRGSRSFPLDDLYRAIEAAGAHIPR